MFYEVQEVIGGSFRYKRNIGIIDYFKNTMSIQDLMRLELSNLLDGFNIYDTTNDDIIEEFDPTLLVEAWEKFKKAYDLIIADVEKSLHEKPHTVRFIYVPSDCVDWEKTFDLVGISKISNNGMTTVYSSNKNYLESIRVN